MLAVSMDRSDMLLNKPVAVVCERCRGGSMTVCTRSSQIYIQCFLFSIRAVLVKRMEENYFTTTNVFINPLVFVTYYRELYSTIIHKQIPGFFLSSLYLIFVIIF